ncbi:MAG TPA: lysoplasmalogenase family protein [Mycobacteriales bacterium]|nr:lysoplasmalogenase family protein [Mycobacteriales bacterium]
MNGTTAVLLAAAAVTGAVDWVAVARDLTKVERIAKPLVMVLLIGAAAALNPQDSTERAAFVIALVLGLVGDVLLLEPDDEKRFLGGLGAFLFGHGAYLAGLAQVQVDGPGAVVGVAVVLVVLATVGRVVIRGAKRKEGIAMAAPVAAYVLVLCAVIVLGLGTQQGWAVAGVLLFGTSDALIGLRQFVERKPWMDTAVAVTYHVAQALLVVALL